MVPEKIRVAELLASAATAAFSRDGVLTPCHKLSPEQCLGMHAVQLRMRGFPLRYTYLIGYDKDGKYVGEQRVLMHVLDGTSRQIKRGWDHA